MVTSDSGRPRRWFRRLAALAGLAVIVAAVSFAALAWTSVGGLTAIWPTNVVVLLAILRGPRERSWVAGALAAGYAGMVAAVMVGGAPLIGAALISLTNMIEIGVAVWLLSRLGLMGRDLTQPGVLLGFLLCAAVVAPAAGAGAAAPLLARFGDGDMGQIWWDYWSADALGVMILAPFGMVLTREHLKALARRRDLAEAAALLAVMAAACVLLVRSDAAQLALLAPLAVLATLRFGALGAAGSVLWAGMVAVGLNLAGGGTVAAGSPDLRAELFQLQLGLAMLPLATLPVAAVLAQRDKAAREARAADRAKSEFLANMSHEIRTPLNGVVGLAGLLAEGAADAREREVAEIIRSSGVTLERLLSDILDLARLESGGLALQAEPFDLGEALRATGALAALQARAKGLDFQLDIAPGADGPRLGDGVRLRQVLDNLLSNAVKFTEAGEVRLSAEAAGDGVRITVRDTGVGFDPARKAEVFGRFQQADGSITRRYGGTGLGLAISRQLVEGMGGTLEADSRPGEGSVFTATLPLPVAAGAAAEAAAAEADAVAASEPAGPGEAAARTPRILLADDHATNRKVVELILAQAGLAAGMVSVEDGAQAVAAFEAGAFDLVLMDMQMPVMDGLTAVRRIRALQAGGAGVRAPILMLTANALPEHAAASRAAGADAHLTKPISAAALLAAVDEALSGAGREALAA